MKTPSPSSSQRTGWHCCLLSVDNNMMMKRTNKDWFIRKHNIQTHAHFMRCKLRSIAMLVHFKAVNLSEYLKWITFVHRIWLVSFIYVVTIKHHWSPRNSCGWFDCFASNVISSLKMILYCCNQEKKNKNRRKKNDFQPITFERRIKSHKCRKFVFKLE